MTLSRRSRRRFLTCLVSALCGAAAAYFYTRATVPPGRPDFITWHTGVRIGFLIAGATSAFEVFVVYGTAGAALRRLPFLQLLALRTGAHGTIIMTLLLLNMFVGQVLGEDWAYDFHPKQFLGHFIFSLAGLTVALFIAQAHSLVGARAITNLVLGRYHRPRKEERLFLLLDLKGSTPLSVRLGDARFHELLSAVFFDIDGPITERGGEIYEYVGDAVIASWRLGSLDREQHAVNAVFAARDALRQRSDWYRHQFDAVPELRAVLHRGSVVAGECGASKRQIVYRGETLNTIARLEGLAKALSIDVLASDTGQAVNLPVGVLRDDLGSHELRGLAAPVRVFSLVAANPTF